MAKTQFLDYTIYLTDAALVAQLQAAPHAGGAVGRTILAPSVAATTYSAPIQEETSQIVAPCIRSEWFTTGNNFPRDQRTFQRCNGGWFGICFLFGTTTKFYWRGQFKWMPVISATVAPTGGVKVAMAKRRFTDGAELARGGESNGVNFSDFACRAASRHLQGYGYQWDETNETIQHTFNESDAAAPTTSRGWDRFYIRIRKYPTANTRIWRTASNAANAAGVWLGIDPSGRLLIGQRSSGGVETVVATVATAVPLHIWKKIDCLFVYKSTAKGTSPAFSLYVNGVNVAELLSWPYAPANDGLALDGLLAFCQLGLAVHNNISIQVDDWIGAEHPTGTSLQPSMVGTLPGIDWNHGSRVTRLSPKAFGSDNAASWAAAGDWRLINQHLVQIQAVPAQLQNATSGARLCVLTDADREIDNQVGALGLASMVIAFNGKCPTTTGVGLGLRLPSGTVQVIVTSAQDGVNNSWRSQWYQPSMNDPIHPCAGLELILDKAANASLQTVQSLTAAAEIIGVFGQEDIVPSAETAALTPSPTINLATQTAAYVAQVKAMLVERGIVLTGDCGAHQITKRVAWGLRDVGAGLQIKTTGANCAGKAVAIIMFASGRAVDILGDAGGANTPQWNEIAALSPTLYALPANPGDDSGLSGPAEHTGIHNAPYAHTAWARRGSPPFSPVLIQAGTYVGTGTFIDITFRGPIHLLMIRAVASHQTHWWWASMQNGHVNSEKDPVGGDGISDVLVDPTFPAAPPAVDAQEQRVVVRIIGSKASINGAGLTYQYTAFGDPAQRFCEAGALIGHVSATDLVTPLNNEGFTPDCVFAWAEQRTGGNGGGFFKGQGHTALNISPLDAAEIAGMAFAKGTITGRPLLHSNSYQQIAYLAFRKADGNNDAGQPRVLATSSYTGDGTASRTVGLLMGGRRPLWALVVPHNAAAIFRDVSHTGTTSTAFPASSNAATGITGGGLDSISVGSALNSNGIVYDVFVLPGDTVALNGGFSQNGEFIPVAPDSPIGGDVAGAGLWDATPPDPELSPNEPATGAVVGAAPTLPDGQTSLDFETSCVAATTFIINAALSHIGVSKQIGNIVTELSELATTSRLHYSDDVNAALRDFPWPFATRYARLVLVAGTATVPVNGDWQYSYRAPADSIFNRRLVNPTLVGRGFDPDPPKFRVGSDATGLLIYTNETPTSGQPGNVTPELEYTIRTTCVALQGDSLFRNALSWRHAFSICAALAKDPEKRAPWAWSMYRSILETARLRGAQEKQEAHDGDADWINGRA